MPPSRTGLFIDTAYLLALVNVADQRHAVAIAWQQYLRNNRRPLLTTEFVLLEVADGLASVQFRNRAEGVIRSMRSDRKVNVIPVTTTLFEMGLALYRSRPDKHWGLTDCTSFVVMHEHGLTEVLTSDDHFRQAGFRVLLESVPA